ncbi:DIRC2 [Mytilus coruscus]|uniref:DIRC2 n=1 Tax=Mytilus coruscus TaxID=42192 RepID=A0A6J8A6V2_MYTCO|nr:DIRC2 [Mytilus coruscus]
MEAAREPLLKDDQKTVYDSIYPNQAIVINTSDNISDVGVLKDTDNKVTNETKLYKRRWYILVVFSLIAFAQGGIWNTWGPIAEASEEAFGWTDGDIALFANWGPIAYLIATFPLAWIIDVKGLRPACVISTFLVAAGAGVRCITDDPEYISWTVNIGQLLNGLAGPVAMGGPPVLSALWFPANERTTATAINLVFNNLGLGVSFIIGPYFVPDKPDKSNTTTFNTSTADNQSIWYNISQFNETRIHKERAEIMKLMYWECGLAVLVFLLVLVYFPNKPKLPPSLSASAERVDFKIGIKQLFRNGKFWLIGLTYGVSLGVYGCWQSVLDVILKPHNISEEQAGWLGFYSLLAGCIVTLAIARFADVFSKHMRLFLLFLYVGAAGSLVWFTFLIQGTIPNSQIQLYASIIIFCMMLGSTSPLYFEMACEASYPVAEGVTNLVLTLLNNIGGLVFLIVLMVPNIGSEWENWCLIGAIASCIPVLAFLKERYNRLEIDETEIKVD